ncbi:MAG: hypothetical protein Q8O92_13380 [Candidatus Latescibacter sp.]|nr:hypothetical protein [Candidatus Latescibacter sp.]
MRVSSFKKTYTALKACFCILSFLCAAPLSSTGQQEISGRQFPNRQDAPVDSSSFTITGERLSTVEFVAEPLALPPEIRTFESSPSLRESEKPLVRSEAFALRKGFFASFNGFFGSDSPLNMTASASYDDKDQAGTIRLHSRTQKLNTPANLAPLVQNIEAFGYRNISLGKLAGEIQLTREADDILGNHFRFRDRRRESYSVGVGIKPSHWGAWDMEGRVRLGGGSYHDFETHDQAHELSLSGEASLSGDIDEVSVAGHSSAGVFRFGGRTGSLFEFGADGVWLPMDELSVKGGAGFHVSSMPGDGARVRFCPDVSAEWAISPSSFAAFTLKRAVIRHTFGDLYDANGLLTYGIPLLFEDRKYTVTAEYGRTLRHGIRTTARLFTRKSDHAPVFSRKGNFFEVIPDARVTLTGVKVSALYDHEKFWGADGDLTVKRVSWNFSGKVPYIPLVEAAANGYVIPGSHWLLYGTMRFTGTHYVEKGSLDTAKGFLTIDIGAEREIWGKSVKGYVDIKNLLNSGGAWWTDEYRIPGIGVFAGVKARY